MSLIFENSGTIFTKPGMKVIPLKTPQRHTA